MLDDRRSDALVSNFVGQWLQVRNLEARRPSEPLFPNFDDSLRDGLRREGVHLLGRVPDVAAWLRRAELLVHPARWEGFGLALLEAMLAELPVVATRVSSIPEIVVDGETGLLVPADDTAALAAAVSRVLDDPGDLGLRGRQRAQDDFSVARMADRTLDVYRRAGST